MKYNLLITSSYIKFTERESNLVTLQILATNLFSKEI